MNSSVQISLPWWVSLLPLLMLAVPIKQAVLDLQTQQLRSQADQVWNQTLFDEALSLRRQAARLSPQDAQLQLDLAKTVRSLWYLRQTAALQREADGAFEKAAALDAHWSEPAYEHALMYAFKDQPEKALALLEPALKLDPNNGGYWLQRGRYLELAHRPAEAQQAYAHCFDLNQDPECAARQPGQP